MLVQGEGSRADQNKNECSIYKSILILKEFHQCSTRSQQHIFASTTVYIAFLKKIYIFF